uniref:glycosyltransferase family 4 protein n=1 Tax=Candidatus Electronema sp. TaxID=2698783 RepID=UPI0040574F03
MKVIFFAAYDGFLCKFCLPLARSLRDRQIDVVLMSPPGDSIAQFKEEGFRWLPLPMKRSSLNPLRELFVLRSVYAACRQEAPDAMHSFCIKAVVYGGLAAQAARVKKRIHAVTGMGYVFSSSSLKARLLRPVVKALLKLALRGKESLLIVQNPDDRQLFIDCNVIQPDKIYLIRASGSGVDADYFSPARQQRSGKFKVLLAARLLREKGIKEYAAAAALLAHRAGQVEFLLAGAPDDSNPGSLTNAEITEIKQVGHVTVLGYIADMRRLLNEVDLFVLPSCYREGVPQVLLEAASMSLPLITTDAPGCREAVDEGVNGFLIPVRNAAALVEKIEYLLDHPELCLAFGRAGREKVLQEFDQKIIFQQTWAAYRSLGLMPDARSDAPC